MRPAFYDNSEYKKKQSDITKKYWINGVFKSLVKPLEKRSCLNPNCINDFLVKAYDKKKYCGNSCAARTNNLRRLRKTPQCLVCNKFTKRLVYKYCSLKCQSLDRYNQYINRWKLGLETGGIGITTKTISAHLRRYLREKYGDKCSICGWGEKHPKTLVTPLEVNHIDGNASNNNEGNLQVICPNCHSLTPNFRNLNKGKGRVWRLRYLKSHRKT